MSIFGHLPFQLEIFIDYSYKDDLKIGETFLKYDF